MFRKLVIISGPTGSGKSKIAIELAKLLKSTCNCASEIINADSMQLYNELPILTAQPTKSAFNEIPHHLYSIIPPTTQMNVVEWNQKACDLIDEMRANSILPIVVGGTGFYINSLMVGIPQAPQVTAEIREYAKKTLEIFGREKFYNQLLNADSRIEYKIQKNDTQRILRAYEVLLATGKSILTFENKINLKRPCEIFPFVITLDREINTKMINTRLLTMVKDGVLEEIESYNRRFTNLNCPLNNALGYKEFSQYLAGEISLGDAISVISMNSKRYAKRQRTWFRNKLPEKICINIDDTDDSVVKAAQEILEISFNKK